MDQSKKSRSVVCAVPCATTIAIVQKVESHLHLPRIVQIYCACASAGRIGAYNPNGEGGLPSACASV